MDEEEYSFDEHTYLMTKLPLVAAKETLLRLTKLGFFSGDEDGLDMGTITSKLNMSDLDFFEKQLFGAHLQLRNESGNWVPLGKAVANSHFNGRLGQYFHMIAKALIFNFSDFLDELHIDHLLGGDSEAG